MSDLENKFLKVATIPLLLVCNVVPLMFLHFFIILDIFVRPFLAENFFGTFTTIMETRIFKN